jgi:hypothetical protein
MKRASAALACFDVENLLRFLVFLTFTFINLLLFSVQRCKTLLTELKHFKKSSVFKDQRLGESGDGLSQDEKQILRLAAVRKVILAVSYTNVVFVCSTQALHLNLFVDFACVY